MVNYASEPMSENALLTTVQDQAEDGDFEELNDIFGRFNSRVEELHWREDREGALYVAQQARSPEAIAKIELVDGSLAAEEITLSDLPRSWDRLIEVSSPDSGVQDRQYD